MPIGSRKLSISSLFQYSRRQKESNATVVSFPLLDLPQEILERVIVLARPLDIVSLSRTCRVLHALTTQRRLWLEVAEIVTELNNMVIQRSLLDAMSLRDLIHFSASSTLFLRRLESLGQVKKPTRSAFRLRPRTQRALPVLFPPKRIEDDGIHATYLTLVSGGRFLLAQHTTPTGATARLLRLSDAGDGTLEVYEVAVKSFEGYCRIHNHWATSHRRTVLRFAVLEKFESSPSTLAIYDVDTATIQPEFTLVARSSDPLPALHPRSLVSHCDERRVALCGECAVAIWDFIHDRMVSFKCPRAEDPRYPYHVKVVDNRVLYFQQSLILIYQLPEDADGHLCTLEPSFRLAVGDDGLTVNNVYFSRAPAIPNQPFRFHVHSWSSDTLRTYELPPGSGVPFSHPLRAVHCPRIEARDGCEAPRNPWAVQASASYTTCDGTCFIPRPSSGLRSTVLWFDLERENESGEGSDDVRAGHAELVHRDDFSRAQGIAFDPATGRLCVASESGGLLVADYV
ncbi:uncharacterized protein SCHCODRAFT_02581950 [Schizophyllum commune H4-8]|uniref:uncharacterized protein n=1 Tax=Schizophyllum commune (strain H4-8 / FGSC 9210) TaxID=578458 RepID=UPI0021602CBE|nr:uncharacterized protein SCHCODRAFT_02581950 [Schizophyllum commune H4-8]KAI5891791.1 hypothetical protein SCHCODRAFT_02581950 [Schizophyllum commune H4-8]